ncbi:hypothetical protein FJY70_01295 [candidate division WOR-3 bacterium]|nr:hypothetical protein [candidate division WOR-3 bacterium]
MSRTFALLALLAASSSAQQWEFEPVDSVGWGTGLRMRHHPNGSLYLFYAGPALRMAWKDSTWHYEDFSFASYGFDMNISASGTVGIVYTDYNDSLLVYSVRTGEGWLSETLPCVRVEPVSPPRMCYDSADQPAILVMTHDTVGCPAVLLVTRPAGTWQEDTLAYFTGQPDLMYAIFEMQSDPWGRPVGMYLDAGDRGGSYREYLYVLRFSGDSVQGGAVFCAFESYVASADLALDSLGRHGVALYNEANWTHCTFYCGWDGGSKLDTLSGVGSTAVAFDPLGRPQVAYDRSGTLFHLWREDTVWHRATVPRAGANARKMTTSDSCQPVIAITSAQGLELAHGVNVVGQAEEPQRPTANSLQPTASVVGNVLLLPVSPLTLHYSLFDMSGRRVMSLVPGANDVSCLAPGVYFIGAPHLNPLPQGEREQSAAAARKVVIAK